MFTRQLVIGLVMFSAVVVIAVSFSMKGPEEPGVAAQSTDVQEDRQGNVSKQAWPAQLSPPEMGPVRPLEEAFGSPAEAASSGPLYMQGIAEQSSQDNRVFLEPSGERVTASEFKAWAEMNTMTQAMQQGPEAFEHYMGVKARKEQRTMLKEENRLAHQQYRESERQWRLRLAEARRIASETGDSSEYEALKNQRPVRPKRIRPEDLPADPL
ncbi:MAG TPA: hypothetical protein ENN05_06010 [Deltaproteobacteria bacterium]|nr:hypothetical protein [Deltaproteobacteria bacterium]